ncbi:hypothetical protein EN816_00610 [Mesorhizobium sp. M8A.F.Ca.ET.173.01.1.1]|nr:hypothetical protein EN816_00610 [Mesorhizobium sp. M8A.F.Ca.ET.173.01.1.1]
MNVLGTEIPQDAIDRLLKWFPPARSFSFSEFQSAAVRCGIPFEVADRAADRILQKARKAGTLAYSGGKWRRV